MDSFFANPLFGMFLTIVTFLIGQEVSRRVKSPIANPLLITMFLCMVIMKTFGISYDSYMKGGQIIALFLVPVTAMLGLSIYRQKSILKEQFFPIFAGCFVGSVLSMGSVVVLCRMLSISNEMTASLLPKSVTTAIAIDLSSQVGGIPSITLMAVILCGTGGAIIHPLIIKLLKLKDPVAVGVAFGTSSHAVGTSKAIEIGEVEGAVSGVSMGVAGICTVMIALFL